MQTFSQVYKTYNYLDPPPQKVYVSFFLKTKIVMKMITISLKCWKCMGINIFATDPYLRQRYLGQDIDGDSLRKKRFCIDSMMYLLHVVL